MRAVFLDELVARRRDTGAAALYATHDAEEALGLADRVALLRDGRLLQVGTPQQVYDEPVDLFAARLTGAGVGARRAGRGGRVLVRPGWARLGGPLEGRRARRCAFRGPHSDHLLGQPAGRGPRSGTPGPPRHRSGDLRRGLDPGARPGRSPG